MKPRTIGQRPGIQVGRSYPSIIEVHRTSESVSFFAIAAMDIQCSRHEILPAGIVVDSSSVEMNIVRTKSLCCLREYCLLADAHGFVDIEPMSVSPIVFAV